jgi:hypothetical protein
MTITALASIGKEIETNQQLNGGGISRVMNAIRQASQSSGVDFSYLVKQAAQESSFRPDVKAKTSSATGLYQFTEQTWLGMVRDYGDKHGVGALAEQINRRPDGTLSVKNNAVRQQILELRKNPEMASVMAAELAQENHARLKTEVGGEIGNTELYLAHFLGAGGATQFLQALRGNPHGKADELLPAAADANRSVFYDGAGRPRTVAQIYDRFAAKMDGKGIDIPDRILTEQPQMLAALDQTLQALPNLRLNVAERVPEMQGQGLSESISLDRAQFAAAQSKTSFAGGVTSQALFSVMLMAQMDAASTIGTSQIGKDATSGNAVG